jgi:hypothetical protein
MPRPAATTPKQEAIAVDTVLNCKDDQHGASQDEWQKQNKSLAAQTISL